MHITIVPVGRGRFAASIEGRTLPDYSTDPFLDAARLLLSEGVSPDEELTMSHQGSTIVSLRSTVGKAAKLTVVEGDRGTLFAKYRPFPGYSGFPSYGNATDGVSPSAGSLTSVSREMASTEALA